MTCRKKGRTKGRGQDGDGSRPHGEKAERANGVERRMSGDEGGGVGGARRPRELVNDNIVTDLMGWRP